MRPPAGQLLEAGWALASAQEHREEASQLFALPEGLEIPWRVREITGIDASMLIDAPSPSDIRAGLANLSEASNGRAIVHYAQFEKFFFEPLLPGLRYWCTQKIALRLYPNLPSRNIRAILGYFGVPFDEVKRAGQHVAATVELWRRMVPDLEAAGVFTADDLDRWLAEEKKPPRGRPDSRVDRLKRLDMPKEPGIYRMKNKSGAVLYVGKATVLKDRVNSYFRGRKGKERRKQEMIAQVWDVDVSVCASALEAAVLEADEIKRLDPPYNRSLKAGSRQLFFFDRAFANTSHEQSEAFPYGPFTKNSAIEQIRILPEVAAVGTWARIFYEPLPAEAARDGWAQWLAGHGWAELPSSRALLSLGIMAARAEARARRLESVDSEAGGDDPPEESIEDEEETLPEDAELTAEDIAHAFERLLVRAGAAYLRARRLTGMLNTTVRWQEGGSLRSLSVVSGQVQGGRAAAGPMPWAGLGVADYDRMSVLATEVDKRGGKWEKHAHHAHPASFPHPPLP